jgi:cardiolipin synthase
MFFFLSILLCCSGCATLPIVSVIIEETSAEQKPRQISSSSGLLSPGKSKAIMSRLNNSGESMDILERHTVVMESVTSNPLTKGNKVKL